MMISKLRCTALILSLSYGCGSDPVPLKQAVIDRGKLLCHEVFRCKAEFPLSASIFTDAFGSDEAICNSDVATTALKYEAAEKSGTLTYTEDKYQKCTNRYAQFFPAQSCDVFWTATDPAPAPECETEITGKVAEGGACVLDAECVGTTLSCSGGKCELKPVAARSVLAPFRAMRW